jgi:small subunit ribosomal protein S1
MSLDVNETIFPATEPLQYALDQQKVSIAETEAVESKEDENSFEKLLEAYEGRTQSFSEGEVISGKVIAITGGNVIIDVGFKSEGVIPIEQFLNDQGKITIKTGDSVDVFLEQT